MAVLICRPVLCCPSDQGARSFSHLARDFEEPCRGYCQALLTFPNLKTGETGIRPLEACAPRSAHKVRLPHPPPTPTWSPAAAGCPLRGMCTPARTSSSACGCARLHGTVGSRGTCPRAGDATRAWKGWSRSSRRKSDCSSASSKSRDLIGGMILFVMRLQCPCKQCTARLARQFWPLLQFENCAARTLNASPVMSGVFDFGQRTLRPQDG